MTKIFLATPAFDGKVHVQYSIALAETLSLLLSKNIECIMKVVASGSLLVAERNRLVEAFMQTDCTHMLFIDSDLGWPAQAILEMLKKDMDVMAGCYPARKGKDFFFRPICRPDGSLEVDIDKKLIKMQYIPAGFMLIKRNVIETIREDNPQLYFEPKYKSEHSSCGYMLFNTELMDGEFWGEDYVFCKILHKSGFDIWCDPLIQFDHAGVIGMLAEVLTDDASKAQKIS